MRLASASAFKRVRGDGIRDVPDSLSLNNLVIQSSIQETGDQKKGRNRANK